MMRIYRDSGRRWQKVGAGLKPALTMALILMLLLLISMIGCNRRYVVVNGAERVTITKESLDKLYQDNELLLKALEQCHAR